MLRPRKMKYIELTVLKKDMDTVLEFLGRCAVIHFPDSQKSGDSTSVIRIKKIIDRLVVVSEFLGIETNDISADPDFSVPDEADEKLTEGICISVESLKNRKIKIEQEKQSVQQTLNEARSFSKLNVPFSELESLSYLALRIGRLDPKGQAALRENLGDRAVIIPLDEADGSRDSAGNRILAVSSRKGRFALDSQLKKVSFEPVTVPQDYNGIPSEMLISLEQQLMRHEDELKKIESEKEKLRRNIEMDIKKFVLSWKTALKMEELKSRFTETENLFHFSGWTPEDSVAETTKDLSDLTNGRIAVKTYSPQEVPSVTEGSEKVPVYLKHGAFVKGFEGVVFSYGAPLYGTIDPTPLVAFFFTLLFGIMFGDVGQGFVLFLAGLLIRKGPKMLGRFENYSIPLISIGLSSMFFGLLFGAFFTNETLFIGPTRVITEAITGQPVDRIIAIMPLAELGGSLSKLIYFFGFTVAVGSVLISIGLIINIVNHCILKKYEEAFFSKSGLAGLLLFWYAIFIAIHILLGIPFAWFDMVFLLIPAFCIFFGPVIWRLIAAERPVFQHGFMTFFMEGFVEMLETVSGYVSNTVSFLRVGAFALSHTVLSFIVFRFYEMLSGSGIAGTFSGVLIMIFGNAIIIVLEGMIVAIQVIRLQYYEFFNKFFVETGVEFAPFRFHTGKI